MFAVAAVVDPVEAPQPEDFEAVPVDEVVEVEVEPGLAGAVPVDPFVAVAAEPPVVPVPAMQAPRVTVATRLAATVAIRDRWAARRRRGVGTMGSVMLRILGARRKTPPSAA